MFSYIPRTKWFEAWRDRNETPRHAGKRLADASGLSFGTVWKASHGYHISDESKLAIRSALSGIVRKLYDEVGGDR